jgi:hypothetical protein
MSPFDMNYSQDVLFSTDLVRVMPPQAVKPVTQQTEAVTVSYHPAPTTLAANGHNPAALRLAIAAERPAGLAERIVDALDAGSLVTSISFILAYLAVLNAI